jgi:hypothetical protein
MVCRADRAVGYSNCLHIRVARFLVIVKSENLIWIVNERLVKLHRYTNHYDNSVAYNHETLMPIQKITKEELLRTSAQAFRANGFTNTSMADLALACGLNQGAVLPLL